MADLAVGDVFAGHRIDAVAGRGGMGLVYKAHDLMLDQTRALKVISGDHVHNERFRERFRREIKLAASIEHPHIIPVYHAGEEGEVLYVVMRYVEGTDLQQLLEDEGRLEPGRAVSVLSQTADALDTAHARDLIHRDVKPPNILLATVAGTDHVYLTDFGVARKGSSTSRFTVEGSFIGTHGYAAPEQLRGEQVTPATDVYALACIAFEALTGDLPFPHEAVAGVVAGHLFSDPPRVRETCPDLPSAVDEVVRRALAKDPGERWPSAGEFCAELEAALEVRSFAVRPAAADVGEGGHGTAWGDLAAPVGETRLRDTGPPLVGRAQERLRLRRALVGALERRPTLTLIIGEAGIGKSRLVRDLVQDAAADQVVVLWGECVPLAREDFPYSSIASALGAIDLPTLQSAVSALHAQGRRELAHVFPAVLAATDAEFVNDEAAPQSRLFGWILALLRAVAADRCTLLVVEDIHWADLSTRDFLQFLVRNMRSERLAVVCTLRSDEPRADGSIRRLVVDLCRDDRVKRIDLPPLTKESVARLMSGLLGRVPGAEIVETLFARAEGNPFYTEALVTAGRDTEGALPPTIRDVLLIPMEDLSSSAREVVRASAVIGRPVEHGVLRVVAGLSEESLLRALRETVDRGVLISERDTGLFRFRHALLREAVQDDLNAAETAAFHRAIAAALQASGADANSAELGRHWEAVGELAPALQAFFDAGLASSGVSAYSEALHHFEHALELWDRFPSDDRDCSFDRVDILSNAAEAARWTGDFERAQELCRAALHLLDESSDPTRAAALYERLGRYEPWNIEASRAAYARALELLPEAATSERARLLTDDALALSWNWRWRDAKARADAALQTALTIGSPADEGSARAVLGVATANFGDSRRGERELRRALELVQEFGAIEAMATVQLDLADVLRLQGRTEDALTLMLEGERLTSAHGADAYASFMAVSAADDLFTLGRWLEVDQALERISESKLSLTGRLLLAIVRGRLATGRGRLHSAAETLESAMTLVTDDSSPSFLVVLHAAVAELELWQARPDDGQTAITRALQAIGDREDVLYAPALFSLGVRVEAELAQRARITGEPWQLEGAVARARALVTRLERLGSRAGEPGISLPIVDAHLVLAAGEMSRVSGASSVDAWVSAGESWRLLGQLPLLAYARVREAEARLALDPHSVAAEDTLRSAYSTALAVGARSISDWAELMAHESGLDLILQAPTVAPGTDGGA